MAFITRCCAKLLLLSLLLISAPLYAERISSVLAEAELGNQQVEVRARMRITLPEAVETALRNGASLPFTFEFDLRKPGWKAFKWRVRHWFGNPPSQTCNLSYQQLTRQYRVNCDRLYRNFNSLNEALHAAGSIAGWVVIRDAELAKASDEFRGKIRLFLDLDALPHHVRLSAMGNPQWEIDSGWVTLNVVKGLQ